MDRLQRIFDPVEAFSRQMEARLTPSDGLMAFLGDIDGWVWGNFLAFILVGTGLFIAWKFRFVQLRRLGHAIALVRGKYDNPNDEGLVAMIGPFVDTLLICTMTALVILMSGLWSQVDPSTGLQYDSTILSKVAFEKLMPGFGGGIVSVAIVLFTFSTIIGWSYYGDRSVDYLFGKRGIKVYRWIYILLIPIGAAMKVKLMWTIADITNGLMAFPNLVALIFLSPIVGKMLKDYFSREQRRLR